MRGGLLFQRRQQRVAGGPAGQLDVAVKNSDARGSRKTERAGLAQHGRQPTRDPFVLASISAKIAGYAASVFWIVASTLRRAWPVLTQDSFMRVDLRFVVWLARNRGGQP